jgi:predicted amidohydrolase YtcJ
MADRRLLLRDADVYGIGRFDLRIRRGVIAELGPGLAPLGDDVIDCGGAAVLPGLHDHHIHMLAAAAAAASVQCGPPAVTGPSALSRRLRSAAMIDGWIRGVGYDESVAGDLDARMLDRLSPHCPTRIQHRSGALWIVNTAGIRALRLAVTDLEGVERDPDGRPTGRLWRMDAWLRERLPDSGMPDIASLSGRLAAFGVTGVTDATPDLSPEATVHLAAQTVQRLTVLGAPHSVDGVGCGPCKIVLRDDSLPALPALIEQIRETRPRAVALHCVTREALVLAVAALCEVGSVSGDRVEHAAVSPPELITLIARLGVRVVTQPSLIAQRGDDYLERVDADDLPFLWPFGSLVEAGVPVGCSSDAPYGDIDPWASIVAAVARRAPSGRIVGVAERVSADVALRGYLSAPDDPGGAPRRLAVGAHADLAVLDRPVTAALGDPGAVQLMATVIDGRVAYSRSTSAPSAAMLHEQR